MTMVARTLVGEQKEKDGRVRRHIFSAEFMQKMSSNPMKWSWEDHQREILPQHIGYNLGDCDFIFGPTLFNNHWFCYVLEIKTMQFYALDSLVDQLTYLRLQREGQDAMTQGEPTHGSKKKIRKQPDVLKGKEMMASGCVSTCC